MRKITPLIFATVILFTATPAGAQSCNVQKGDSMWRIAKEYNVIFPELLRLNRHFTNQNLIHPHDRVELPDGSAGASSGKANTQGTDARTDDTADKDASEQARAVMESWMNSSGHRANILNKNYKYLGVGFCTGGRYGTYWVQEFTG